MSEKNIDEKLADQWESLTHTVLRVKAERDTLLAALKRIVELSEGYPLLQAELDIPLARAAIEKAEGR